MTRAIGTKNSLTRSFVRTLKAGEYIPIVEILDFIEAWCHAAADRDQHSLWDFVPHTLSVLPGVRLVLSCRV